MIRRALEGRSGGSAFNLLFNYQSLINYKSKIKTMEKNQKKGLSGKEEVRKTTSRDNSKSLNTNKKSELKTSGRTDKRDRR